jgi:hypothetical protein
MTVSRMSTRLASGAISPWRSSHGGNRTQAISAPIIMLALTRSPMMMPDPMLSSETAKPTPARAEKALRVTGMASTTQRSCVARNVSPDATRDPTIANVDCRASGPRESSMMRVSPAATPSGKRSCSSSMKWRRSGTAISTPRIPAAESQIQVFSQVRCTSNPLPGSAARMSKAASSQQRKAICPAVVPAVWTTLFSQRLYEREKRPSARKPKKAETTEMLGPKPNLSTM